MAQTEDGKSTFNGICEDGRIRLDSAIFEDGKIILVLSFTKTFISDALFKKSNTKTLTCDSTLVGPAIKTFATDAVLSGRISGITRDTGGSMLGNCTVWLFKTSDKSFVEETTSNASGEYSFGGVLAGIDYFIRAFKDGTPNVFGATDDNLEVN